MPRPACTDRRGFLRLSLGGLASALAWPALGGARREEGGKADRFILIFLAGGPSHIDTFDPKPGAATGGPFKAIRTAVEGLSLGEHLPRLAEGARRYAMIRSMTSREGNHDRARYLLHTGYAPLSSVQHPSMASLAARDRRAPSGPSADLPPVISINGAAPGAAFLGSGLDPFLVQSALKPIDNLGMPGGVDRARYARRLKLLEALEDDYSTRGGGPEGAAHRDVVARAVRFMNAEALGAFDLAGEPEAVRAAYGTEEFGAGCLMARRLVEAGVPCVEVVLGGWDTHQDNFTRTAALSGQLDAGLSALLADLASRELLGRTLVVCLGEFGRSPAINASEGRDHHPAAWSALLAGGPVRGGTVVGATDPEGAAVVERPVTVPDLMATVAVALGLDPAGENWSPSGRPFKVSDGGTPVAEVVGV
ncbi:MAG: DUF1501 domain-containing protein [Planctomycetes bacterium]|nr:DUF1501 domain-containing protein [Planctomycetota bacterium]